MGEIVEFDAWQFMLDDVLIVRYPIRLIWDYPFDHTRLEILVRQLSQIRDILIELSWSIDQIANELRREAKKLLYDEIFVLGSLSNFRKVLRIPAGEMYFFRTRSVFPHKWDIIENPGLLVRTTRLDDSERNDLIAQLIILRDALLNEGIGVADVAFYLEEEASSMLNHNAFSE
jgi:hypothetical protein